ncbi:MAG: hypothetical protein ACXACB_09665 [Promethearchaeota archaeon]|jgi:predicted phosphoribosyltransferase
MKFKKYESRIRAGEILADFIKNEKVSIGAHLINNIKQYFCFAIPNGGVPVAEGFCSRFKLYYDILIVRKIKIPFNTEAGYGAITTDGTVLFNKPLLNRLNLSEKEINDSINMTKKEISERTKLYNKEPNLRQFYIEKIQNKYVFILDDGLASGFTMLAAINMVKKYQPFDGIFCPNIGDVMWFAVADAYKNWYDVPESEVLKILNNSKHYVSNFKKKTSH